MSNDTQVTNNTPSLAVPDLDSPCQAIITTQIQIIEPLKNGRANNVATFTDNYILLLDKRKEEEAIEEVVERLSEIKKKWQIKQIESSPKK